MLMGYQPGADGSMLARLVVTMLKVSVHSAKFLKNVCLASSVAEGLAASSDIKFSSLLLLPFKACSRSRYAKKNREMVTEYT